MLSRFYGTETRFTASMPQEDRLAPGALNDSSHINPCQTLGWDAVTVPGAVSAWVELSRKFGKLPFHQLFESAINYANNGYQVGPKNRILLAICP